MLRWKDTRRLRVLEPRRAEEIALDRARSGAPIFPDATERQSASTELTVAGGPRVRILPAPAASQRRTVRVGLRIGIGRTRSAHIPPTPFSGTQPGLQRLGRADRSFRQAP